MLLAERKEGAQSISQSNIEDDQDGPDAKKALSRYTLRAALSRNLACGFFRSC